MDTTVRAVVSQMSSSYGCLFNFIHNQLIHSHISTNIQPKTSTVSLLAAKLTLGDPARTKVTCLVFFSLVSHEFKNMGAFTWRKKSGRL